jgi:hypothetical protein
VHCEDTQTHTRVGHRELSREARVETDGEMKEPKELKPALAQNGIASGNKQAGGVDFSDESCFRLLREIVTFTSGINS